MSAPLIVSALFGERDFAWLDEQRRLFFPPERNVLRAHLTLFHHLPPSVESEAAVLMKQIAKRPAPKARIAGLMNLGRGVAYRVESPELEAVRAEIGQRFEGLLVPQDVARWRPHVTIQNKVDPAQSRSLLQRLESGFSPCDLDIAGLALWRYRGGPWESAGAWRFGLGHAMQPPRPLRS